MRLARVTIAPAIRLATMKISRHASALPVVGRLIRRCASARPVDLCRARVGMSLERGGGGGGSVPTRTYTHRPEALEGVAPSE